MSQDVDYLKHFINKIDANNAPVVIKYGEGALQSGIYDDCVDFASYLSFLMSAGGQEFQLSDPQLYSQCLVLWYELIFKGFVVLHNDDQANILQNRILYPLENGTDPDLIAKGYYEFGYSENKMRELLRTLANDLEQNNETLGTNPITVQGRRYLPAVKYWIMDYANFPSQSGRRGSIDRLNYVNKSQNVRPLTQTQKQTLLKILKLYDSFLNPELPPITGGQSVMADLGRGTAIAARPSSFRPSVQPRPTPQPVQVGGIQQRRPATGVPITGRPTAPFIGSRPAVDIDSKLKELRNRKNNAS